MSLLDRMPVERITAQARDVRVGPVVLSIVASVFFAIGWLAFKVCALAWLAVVWCAVATREGWREAQVSHGSARTGQ